MKRFFLFSFVLLTLAGCSKSDWMGDGNVTYQPKKIVLSKSAMNEMVVGENRRLYASFDPAETTKPEILWSSSDDKVVTVDKNGLVSAVGMGTAVIVAKSAEHPEISALCNVSVDKESGIVVYDVLLDEPIEGKVTFVRNSTGERDYYMKVFVHNTFDKSVEIATSNAEIMDVEPITVGEYQGFRLKPGQTLGDVTITVQSTRNDDVRTEIPVSLKTIHVTDIELSENANGSEAAKAITGSLTVSHTKSVRVVFSTDDEEIKTPENSVVNITSSNTAVATADAVGTLDPATQTISFNVYMVDNPVNAGGSSTITATSDDGGYKATYTVTAKCPGVEQIILNRTVSDPIHAGESIQLTFKTIPEDAYVQTVKWVSANQSIATVDANGKVTVNKDFVFDPADCTKTEILITATSDDASKTTAACKLLPYQFVEATGVMVTDQWGNRMRGTSSTASKITSSENSFACIQYSAGGGKNKTNKFNEPFEWGTGVLPAVEGVTKSGSMAVYLTATPYPYTYPTIADPDQPFYWACYSNSRFSVAGAGYEDGSTATGWASYSKDDGKSTCFLGHTCKFWTGHSSSGADVTFVRVWSYKQGDPNSSAQSKTLLLRFTVHTTDSKANAAFGNPSLYNEDGKTTRAFAFLNTNGISQPYSDPCPIPWAGPMPKPGTYYTLNSDGTPDQTADWGEIPVPSALNEIH